MYKINESEFENVKKLFTMWVICAFVDAKTYYVDGVFEKNNEVTFDLNISCVIISVSAFCSIKTGEVLKAFLDEVLIIDPENNEFEGSEINENQIKELNNILKNEWNN